VWIGITSIISAPSSKGKKIPHATIQVMMKNLFFCLLATCFLFACNSATEAPPDIPVEDTELSNTSEDNDDTPSDDTEDNADAAEDSDGGEGEIETENEHLINKDDLSEISYLNTFLPEGHRVLDFEYGDLNKDEHKKDVILIAQDYAAERAEDGGDVNRPLIILTRTPDGKLKKEGRNDEVVLCFDCGGMMGDPYQDIAIKNGYFSIEHFGGSSIRWTEIITFRYNPKKKDWYLHKKGGETFNAANPDEVIESSVSTTKDFGEVKFKDYKL
jgi:hypothetical protein